MTFRFFMDLGLFFHFLAFSDFPGRVARHSQGESGIILIISSHFTVSVSKRFAKNATNVSRIMSGEVLHENQVLLD